MMFVENRKKASIAWLVLAVGMALGASVVATPPDASDPDLRLWLRADDLTGDVGSEVTNWSDASSYGTVFAPPGQRVIFGNIQCPESPADRGPSLIQEVFPGNPNPVPALLFELTGGFDALHEDGTDCEPDFETCCFINNPDNQQRLFQQNNLAETGQFDPLNFGDGNDLTAFVVFKPVLFGGETERVWPGGVQTIFAKRGTNACVYSMGLEGREGTNLVGNDRVGNLILVQYDAVEAYYSDEALAGDVWHISAATIDDSPGPNADEVILYSDSEEDADERLVQLNDPIITGNRNGSVSEAFGIGGHSQQCCGDGERFNGIIAEIIIFARKLDPTEFEEIQDYLNLKYFSPMQPPKNLTCARSPDGTVVDLRWDNARSYDMPIKILRDSVEIGTVASDATNYRDMGLVQGTYSYHVLAEVGGLVEGPVCTVTLDESVRFSTPDPFDPTLRLWLRGSDLVPEPDPNTSVTRDVVTEWNDASSYGTRLGIRQGDEGEPGVVGDEPTYELSQFPGNPNLLPTAKFDVAGAPVKGNQDRLVQTNNLADQGDADPLDIGDGNGLTVIAVYNPLIAGTPELGVQTILGKRGTFSSVYTLGISNSPGNAGKLNYVTYDTTTEYVSDDPIDPNKWHISMMTIAETGANDTLSFFDADGQTLSQTLAQIGGPSPITARNISMPAPFYLAGHAQECCGDGERFAGRIAEVMIFARPVDGDERDQLFGYLNAKYFSGNQPPEGLVCLREGDGTTVDLSWTNAVAYENITIERDGAEIASLSGDATSYQDTSVPSGGRKYDVVATVGNLHGGPTCTARDPAGSDVSLSALTVYGTDDQGTVRISERWNTTFPDPAWDVGLLDGPVVDDPAAYTSPEWLTDDTDASLNITLVPGDTRTYTFAVARIDTFPDWFGMNLFINNSELVAVGGTPAISVFAFSSDFGSANPFMPNSALLTMGWPIADVGGSGSLVFESVDDNFRVTLTDFAVYTQDGLNGGAGIDVVQAQGAEGLFTTAATDGNPDLIGEFTIQVTTLDDEGGPKFRRGDHDGSGIVDITDPLNLLGFLFLGQTPPICADASDADNSMALDISDALNSLGFLFLGSFPLNETLPGPMNCGEDPMVDIDPDDDGPFPNQPAGSIGCDMYPSETGMACQ